MTRLHLQQKTGDHNTGFTSAYKRMHIFTFGLGQEGFGACVSGVAVSGRIVHLSLRNWVRVRMRFTVRVSPHGHAPPQGTALFHPQKREKGRPMSTKESVGGPGEGLGVQAAMDHGAIH